MNERDRLIAWLSDAYAMETELLPILRDHAQDAEQLPEVHARLTEHVTETQGHLERLERALGIVGASSSSATSLKSALASLVGGVMAPGTAFFSDELVKNVLLDYAAEQFEVAAYTALVASARVLGEPEVARLCAENLAEDAAMAQSLLEQLPTVIAETLAGDMEGSRRQGK